MSTIVVPDQSLQQRREGLRRANVVRCARADLKRDLKAGRRHIIALLSDPPDWLFTMKVQDLLLAVPKVGRTKCATWLRKAGIPPSKTIGGMTQRQRGDLRRLLSSQRVVGICAACGGQVVRLARDDEAASCECGAASIPHAFMDAARGGSSS